MRLSFLLRLLVSIVVAGCLYSAQARAQSMSLNATTFYPDSSIIHTGATVKWTGFLSYSANANAVYSLTYTFGDGSGYVVSKTTGSAASGSDTFRAVHAYSAVGTYIAKVVLKNALGVALDSISRSNIAGSGYAVSGRFYYDCTQNCQQDTGELWLGKTQVGIKINQTQRTYWTDSFGYYTVGVAPGDTLRRNTGVPDPYNTHVGYCAYPYIISTNHNADIPVWISDFITISAFSVPAYICKGAAFYANVNSYGQNGAKPWVVFTFSNGYVSPYGYSSNGYNSWSYVYNTSGTYTVSAALYNDNFAGPYMRFQSVVHVDSCQNIQLVPYHDANKNCLADLGEPAPAASYLVMHSKLNGAQPVWYTQGNPLNYGLYPGDTVMADSVLQISGSVYSDTVHLRNACPGLVLTTASPAVLPLPYNTHIKLTSATTQQGTICYADTAHFTIEGRLVAYPANTAFKLIAYYGDGTADSTQFTCSADTITLYPRHRYATPGVKNCTFILKTLFGDRDTIHLLQTIDNCYPVFVRAFYDKNKNCVKDAGENFATSYSVLNGNGNTYYSDAAGLVKCTLYASADSVMSVSDYKFGNSSADGYYTRAITAAHNCAWPLMNAGSTQQLLLPLIDTPTFTFSYYHQPINACDTIYTAAAGVNIMANYGNNYTLVYYYGDGLKTDTLQLVNYWNNSYNFAPHRYLTGTYQPAFRIWDDSTGALISTYFPPAFSVYDTCANGKGFLYADADNSCGYNAGDAPLAGQPVSLLTNSTIIETLLTDAAGRFYTHLTPGSSYVRTVPSLINGNLVPACGTAVTSPLYPALAVSIPYACGGSGDLSLLASHYFFSPGTQDTLLLYPGGTSCNYDAGTLELTLPTGLTYTGANIPGAAISGQQISWAIDSLRKLPKVIRIGLACAPATGTHTLCLSAKITGTSIDPQAANNDFYLCDSVRALIPDYYKSLCSDSMTAAGTLVAGKELIYSLRTANSTALPVNNILLYDTLAAQLSPASLHILDASFAYKAAVLPGGVLRINSDGPAAIAPGAAASIRFGIMPAAGMQVGTPIPNKAAVVLEGIPAGNTNITVAIAGAASTGATIISSGDAQISLYPVPVPTDGRFYIAVKDRDLAGNYEVMDARGALVARGALAGRNTMVSAAGMAPGLYTVRVIAGNSAVYVRKLIVGVRQ